ncbi:Abhydrolase-3 domain-containing protein [Mycena kentingensis (nom. inval.)]|nr:Abhydrolase-3 domain-containing protein [Mycena kentingensis (nom. inval.)]
MSDLRGTVRGHTGGYGQLSLLQTIGMVVKMLPLPGILVWTILVTARSSKNKGKSLKRLIGERAMRYAITHLSVFQLQFAFGTTAVAYSKWTKQVKLAPTVDDLGQNAKLCWVGPKRTERVLLYIPGGCFYLPLADFMLNFLRYIQLELEKKNLEVGVATLEYSLAPYSQFPTPLTQGSLAVDYLYSAGVKPDNLVIAGDSAGANLALQLLSQMLHPIANIPRIQPPTPISGVCCISPWASLTTESKSFAESAGVDFMPAAILTQYGEELLPAFGTVYAAFAEPAKAPADWFSGVESVVKNILMTAGSKEGMRDDILQVADVLKKHHGLVTLEVQDGGVHGDPLLDFMTKESKLGPLTPIIIDWLTLRFA